MKVSSIYSALVDSLIDDYLLPEACVMYQSIHGPLLLLFVQIWKINDTPTSSHQFGDLWRGNGALCSSGIHGSTDIFYWRPRWSRWGERINSTWIRTREVAPSRRPILLRLLKYSFSVLSISVSRAKSPWLSLFSFYSLRVITFYWFWQSRC